MGPGGVVNEGSRESIDSKVDSAVNLDSVSESSEEDSNSSEESVITLRSTSPEVPIMAESRVYSIHKLNGANYQLWRRQMEIYMTENKLKTCILGITVRSATNADSWDEKDAEAQAFIMRGIELDQLRYLCECKTAAEMWSKLKTIYAEKSDQSAQVLLEKFINCKMTEGEIIADYIARVSSIAERLKDMEMEQKPAMVIAKILSSLPAKYDNVRTSWYAVPRNEQTMERLTDHLVNEEALINLRNEDEGLNKTAFVVHGKKRDGYRVHTSQSQMHTKRSGRCNYCNKPGHWARECYKKQKDQSASNKSPNAQRNNRNNGQNNNYGHSLSLQRSQEQLAQQQQQYNASFETADNKSHLFVIQSATSTNKKIYDLWFADSGATDHMTFQKEYFTTFKSFPDNSCFVRVGDGRKLNVQGVGDIEVQVISKQGDSNVIHVMKDVLLIPDLERNFISVICATEKGMKVVFKEGGKYVHFIKNNAVIVDGIRENKLYKMNLVAVKRAELSVATSLKMWHERLGHVNFKTLKEMSAKGTVSDLKITNEQEDLFCDGCAYGKQHRASFPKNCAIRATKPGEIFHVDLCGKMSAPSIGGANYFMLLKDDFSRYCYIYFIKNKTDVLNKLMEFITDVGADGHKIKKLRSDCGLEFCNSDIRRFLLSKDIKHQTSTPRAPEQNGFIERQNRTVVESAKAMLHGRNLPFYLWAEAVNTAVYLKNRTASAVLNGLTPFEKYFGTKPSVEHLRVFGCEVFVHVAKDMRTKWDKNSFKCIMIGYKDDSKAYRVYDPVNKSILIRKDLIFHEKQDGINEVIVTQPNKNANNENDCINKNKEDIIGENKVCKNPRMPIERNPYPIRGKVNINDPEHQLCSIEFEPTSLEEALQCENSNQWLNAINEEINSLNKNKTWELVTRPKNKNIITNRWVFKMKLKSDGSVERFKARLVVKGFLQKYGFDYTEVFAPVVKYESVRMILAIAAAYDLHMLQFDVKTAFLHGEIDEEIFMEQPYGFEDGDKVCLLKKGLYGLKQASRQWNKRFVEYLKSKNFKQSVADACVFLYKEVNDIIYLALYVDDGLICGNNIHQIKRVLSDLHEEFEITYKDAEFFVGMQIERRHSTIKIFQSAYINKVLQKYNHVDCSTSSIPADPGIKFSKQIDEKTQAFPYREAIGSLLYLVVCTRPDICYIVGVLSRYVENPSDAHWQGVKRIFKYLKGTIKKRYNFLFKIQ